MLELLLCSLLTVLPDYLIRRFAQGKRWGKEITFFTMWYELRWGITSCVLLTVALISLIFFYHPSTTMASPFFRTVSILPEGGGRVEEVFVQNNQLVQAGDPLFSLLESSQAAAVEVARSKLAEIDAAFSIAEADLEAAEGLIEQAEGMLRQSVNELRLKRELEEQSPGAVPVQEMQRLEFLIASRRGTLESAVASQAAAEAQIETILPAQQRSAQETLDQAEVELGKTVVRAGVSGHVRQFTLKPGDYVNPILRPAGILVPSEGVESGRMQIQAGFNQLTAPVIKPGTLAEVTCLSKPFTIIPMVVVRVVDVIPAGQLRPSDSLLDIQQRQVPGTITVSMEPLYADGMEDVMPGTKCIANAYTFNHDRYETEDLGTGEYLYLHMVDTVGVVHAIILRIQALLLPVKMLVFAGH